MEPRKNKISTKTMLLIASVTIVLLIIIVLFFIAISVRNKPNYIDTPTVIVADVDSDTTSADNTHDIQFNSVEEDNITDSSLQNDTEEQENSYGFKITTTEEKEYKTEDKKDAALEYYYNYTRNERTETTDKWMQSLEELDSIAKESGLTQLDELSYIRSQKYNTVYWNEMLSTCDNNTKNIIECKHPDVKSLQDEALLNIPNTNIDIKAVHTIASIECIKSGVGSFGSWKGDLAQLARDIKELEANGSKIDVYNYTYSIMASENSSCSIYDINSDITAVNVAAYMTNDMGIKEGLDTYFSYIPYYNQYALFINNEFDVTDISKDELRKKVKSSMDTDLLAEYLIHKFGGYDSEIHPLVYNAFADYLYDNLNGKSIKELLNNKENLPDEKLKIQAEKEYKEARDKKYAEFIEKYAKDYLDGGLDKIYNKLSN